MMVFLKKWILIFVVCLFSNSTPALAASFKIVTPYLGTEENTHINNEYGIELKDSQSTKGLYFQSIDPEKYQWNIFVYQTSDINYSDLLGVNLIYDHYFGVDARTKNVIGVGANYLQLDLAGTNIPTEMGTLDAFELDQEILSLYVRIGRYYNYGQDKIHFTFMPWIGGQLDQSQGAGLVDFSGPGAIDFKIDDGYYSWIGGVNFKADYHHFLQVEAKHTVTYRHEDYFHKSSAMVNLFFTRNLGLSYRYNHHETSAGEDSYNIFGIAVVF